ncbi:MAG: DUF1289 domain-containing protein [Rhizobiaceae bacterium]
MTSIKSPCILICAIEQTSGHCYGCGRTRDEIAAWVNFSPEIREHLMTNELPERVNKLEKRPRRVTKRSRQRNEAKRDIARDIIDLSS